MSESERHVSVVADPIFISGLEAVNLMDILAIFSGKYDKKMIEKYRHIYVLHARYIEISFL